MKPIILESNAVVEDIYTDEKTGKKCIIALNNFGYRLGDVEVDSRVPLKIFDEESVYKYEHTDSVVHFSNIMYNKRLTHGNRCTLLVHGGVTFCGNKEYMSDTYMRAVGFDCAHYNDSPVIESVEKYLGDKNVLTQVLKQFTSKDEIDRHVWTMDEVKAELTDLASQLKEVEQAYLLDLKIKRAKQWKNKKHIRR